MYSNYIIKALVSLIPFYPLNHSTIGPNFYIANHIQYGTKMLKIGVITVFTEHGNTIISKENSEFPIQYVQKMYSRNSNTVCTKDVYVSIAIQ